MTAHAETVAALRRLADALETQGAVTDVDVNDRVIGAGIDEVRRLLGALHLRRPTPTPSRPSPSRPSPR